MTTINLTNTPGVPLAQSTLSGSSPTAMTFVIPYGPAKRIVQVIVDTDSWITDSTGTNKYPLYAKTPYNIELTCDPLQTIYFQGVSSSSLNIYFMLVK